MSVVKGWCPGALRPMESGDGWLVRVRPRGGRLTPDQAAGLAQAARAHGNGRIDLTGRANLQLRGVAPDSHAPLIARLRALDLIDPDITAETRRNIVVTPFADARTDRLARELEVALAACDLVLPGKFGFAVDTGPAPVLADIPADIRLERDCAGRPILRADGMAQGQRLTDMSQAIELAAWFLRQGGASDGRGRMARLIASGLAPPEAVLTPAPPAQPTQIGATPQGMLVALEFGQTNAPTLERLARLGPIRLTPWRALLIEGLRQPTRMRGLILDPADPRLRLRACSGAPGCAQAHAPTRPLARRLAAQLAPGAILHVSGCAKGCGWPRAADITLTATPDGFDLIRDGHASDPARLRGLTADHLPEVL